VTSYRWWCAGALAKGSFAVFKVHDAGRNHDADEEETPERNHFNRAVARLAQMAGGLGCKVEAVEYIVNPALQAAYEHQKAVMIARLVQSRQRPKPYIMCLNS